MSWQEFARCAGADTDIFFDLARRAEAADLCRQCSVVLPCREAGAEEHGWWGGRIGGGQARFSRENRAYQQRKHRLSVTGAARLDLLVAEQKQPPVDPWSPWRQLLNDIDSTSDNHRREDTA